jgi:hypothetical protein
MNYNTLSLEKLVETALKKGCSITIIGGTPGVHNNPRMIVLSSYFTEADAKAVIIDRLNKVDKEDKYKGWITVVENAIKKYNSK